ncbi:MAG TPA: ABC transporter permease [Actinomycetes bacterium]|nr:ABC transporter permease [Actinomycetes bacterium]
MAPAELVALSPRQLVWERRRQALARNWRLYRTNRQGLVGLLVLATFVLIALLSPLIVSPDEIEPATATGIPNHPPYSGYPLGTDNFGRSVLSLIIVGTRISLLVGITATFVAVILGASIGLVSGYYGGTRIDTGLNALTNWFLVIPWLVLAIVLSAILGSSTWIIILVIGITSWATTARLVRAQTLSVRERPYVERARVLGANDWTILTRHILPNVSPVIFANAILTVAIAILTETTLSILGLGDATAISWGVIIEQAFNAGAMTNGYWWWMIPPGVMIVLVTLAFTMCGYALDEVMNPRLRSR